MMRALWTAGQGMISQQFNVDVISNNLANVNTTGFKKERIEFKDLLYETVTKAYADENGGRPVNLQVGHGVAPVATVKSFGTGNLEKTDNPLDFAIEGEGLFMIRGAAGNTVYSRDGSFKVSNSPDGNMLTTSDGYPVLDDVGSEIILNVDLSNLLVGPTGELSYIDPDTSAIVPMGQKIGLAKFSNRYGLESIGSSFFLPTSASGDAIPDEELGSPSKITQNFLESSNVQVVEEMVKLIVAQRAYEINSKSIQTADEMLGMANNLRR
jgi:flagellar basal-body rod protein FlgG